MELMGVVLVVRDDPRKVTEGWIGSRSRTLASSVDTDAAPGINQFMMSEADTASGLGPSA